MIGGAQYRTKNPEILDNVRKFIFDRLGYTELAELMGIPLINLHCGDGVKSNPIVINGENKHPIFVRRERISLKR